METLLETRLTAPPPALFPSLFRLSIFICFPNFTASSSPSPTLCFQNNNNNSSNDGSSQICVQQHGEFFFFFNNNNQTFCNRPPVQLWDQEHIALIVFTLIFLPPRLKASGTAGSRCSRRRTEKDTSRSNCPMTPPMTPRRPRARRTALRASGQRLRIKADVPFATWPWQSCWYLLPVCHAHYYCIFSLSVLLNYTVYNVTLRLKVATIFIFDSFDYFID